MENNESVLKLLDLKFTNFKYENTNEEGKVNLDLNVKYFVQCLIDKKTGNSVKIIFDTYINDKDETFNLSLQAVAKFEIDAKTLTEQEKNIILKRNTIAIIFPFVRSQVSLLTTQPGITPVMLQPIDVDKLNIE